MVSETAVGPFGLRPVRSLKHLRTLVLDRCGLGSDHVLPLARLPQLRVLILGENDVGNRGVKHLSRLPRLKYLDLSSNKRVHHDGLRFLPWLPFLRWLDVGYIKLHNKDLQSICRNRYLQHIDIMHSRINDAGFRRLTCLHQLRSFHIKYSKVYQHGWGPVKRKCPCMGLAQAYGVWR